MGFLDGDLLYPERKEEAQKHKLKRLVQGPKSFFMDVKCPSCYEITPVFSHASSVVICPSCSSVRPIVLSHGRFWHMLPLPSVSASPIIIITPDPCLPHRR